MKKRLTALAVSIALFVSMFASTAQAATIFCKAENDDLLFTQNERYYGILKDFQEHPYQTWYDDEKEQTAINLELTDLAVWYSFERYNTRIVPQAFVVKKDGFFTEKEEDIIATARKKVLNFVDLTEIIKSEDKARVKDYLVSVKFELAEFPEVAQHLLAVSEYDVVYINANDRQITEWIVVHELMHAVKNYLTDGNDWLETGKFVEGMTDAFTYAVIGNPFEAERSGYQKYQDFAYMFLSIFGIKGARAFLYGTLESDLGLKHEELDLFVQCLNHAEDEQYWKQAQSVAVNCLKNWQNTYSAV